MVTLTIYVNEPLDEIALDETSLALWTSYVVETNVFEILPESQENSGMLGVEIESGKIRK